MAGLNDMQEQACEHVDGPLLILAGAGSGKTRVITHRVAYLMEHEGVNPLNILAITFTNKAAREMRERVDLIVGDGADRVWVSTFHSLCVRILRRYADKIGYGKNFDIYDSDDQKSTVKSILKDFQIDPKRYPEKMFMAEISKAKEKYLSPDEFAKKNGPTTSMRMEKFEYEFVKETGVRVIIGKGGMKENTERACKEFGAIHCVFPAGNAVVAATEVEEIVRAEWRDLGMPETLWNCRVKEFGPLIVSIDAEGNNWFEQQKVEFNKKKDAATEEICKQVGFIK